MNNNSIFVLNSTNHQVYPFPWISKQTPCPWDQSKYMRILIPLTEMEKRNSKKKVHTQIVRKQSVREVRPAIPSFGH